MLAKVKGYRAYKLDPSILKRWDNEPVKEVREFAGSALQFEDGPPEFEKTFKEI